MTGLTAAYLDLVSLYCSLLLMLSRLGPARKLLVFLYVRSAGSAGSEHMDKELMKSVADFMGDVNLSQRPLLLVQEQQELAFPTLF